MTTRMSAAIARRAARIAAGVDVAGDDQAERQRLRKTARLRQSPADKRGRMRDRLGRFVKLSQEP
jgi:hypothetical protein